MAAWFAVNYEPVQDNGSALVYVVHVSAKQSLNDQALTDPFDPKIEVPMFVNPPHWRARIRAQRGCFSIHPAPNKEFKPSALKRFEIPQPYWQFFRTRLCHFGIDASTVMADVSGLGAALAWQYKNEVGVGGVGY